MEALQISTPLEKANSVMAAVLDDGLLLRDSVKLHGMTLGQWNWLLHKDKEAAAAVARARKLRADLLVEEAIHIADTEPDAAKARNQIHVRHWTAERFDRPTYGQHMDLTVSQTIDIAAPLAEARARLLRPVCDQQPGEDSQVVDVQAKEPHAVGMDTLPTAAKTPDIFS